MTFLLYFNIWLSGCNFMIFIFEYKMFNNLKVAMLHIALSIISIIMAAVFILGNYF